MPGGDARTRVRSRPCSTPSVSSTRSGSPPPSRMRAGQVRRCMSPCAAGATPCCRVTSRKIPKRRSPGRSRMRSCAAGGCTTPSSPAAGRCFSRRAWSNISTPSGGQTVAGEGEVSPNARAILRVLRREWEMTTADLRADAGIRDRPTFTRALDELQAAMLVVPTPFTTRAGSRISTHSRLAGFPPTQPPRRPERRASRDRALLPGVGGNDDARRTGPRHGPVACRRRPRQSRPRCRRVRDDGVHGCVSAGRVEALIHARLQLLDPVQDGVNLVTRGSRTILSSRPARSGRETAGTGRRRRTTGLTSASGR